MEEKIYFYYTNDLHSNFNNWSRVTSYLKDAKKRCEAMGNSSWRIDIGDHVDRMHPIADAFKGKANVELMNEADYDVITLGNNEGITLSHDELFQLYDHAQFDVVCGNLHSMDQVEPDWLKPSVVLETVHDVTIGVVGLTAPFNAFYELLDWHVSPPYEQLEKIIDDIRGKVDIIILLSHLGFSEDQEIADRFTEIDVIIGGHTHHLLRTGEYINDTLITAAGKHCNYVGEVILTWDHQTQKLVNKEAYTTNISHLPQDNQTEDKVTKLLEQATVHLAEPVVNLTEPLAVNWWEETPIIKALADSIKLQTNADCSMLNAGVLLEGLPEGEVTYGDIHRICPHPINTCVVELTGNELLEVIRTSQTEDFMNFQLKGFGFRGKVLGKMTFSGIELATEELTNGDIFIRQAFLDGQSALEANQTYRVATADTFTFGRLLPEVAKSEVKQYYLPAFLRDILAETLQQFVNEG
ncbi:MULTISPECIES: bifunctional metallophosphatase/5'-nucleotidase [Virgibacillus]|uniref:bifunctional metallophosphatase/5'-nucleotidase n=1 Tax=Virgibacillus TaxID=84406 RepID=UPI0003884935|nr:MULTISPECIES: bifunctional UDP-sugar hydrolase/5'-nucleotidase [Virgibacillus]EQB37318.1 hypothetical protein M948_01915 [Virgibacillus sp. CM-4]MYL40074.1 bifunctional metallophosphatase/5'-nucleotidase [Virgibacillus massiliensis]